jgi:serine/threonine-protein kinase HipA
VDASPLTETAIEKILDATVSGTDFGTFDADDLRISIAGAQEKTALLRHEERWCLPHGATPTTHILKLPLGEVGAPRADFSTSVENEWLCGRIAKAYGLPVANSRVEQFGRHKVLVVERFDRQWTGAWWARLPQEDFCQVLGMSSEQKYEDRGGPGIDRILDVLRGSELSLTDRTDFLSAQMLFWLLAAPDGHAKNFSIFLEPLGRFRLTPLYDVMSAWPVIGHGDRKFSWHKIKLAMALRSENAHYHMAEIHRRHWNTVARRNALGADFEPAIRRFIELTPEVLASVSAQLPPDFPEAVYTPIFEGLQRQVRKLADQGA